VEQVGTTVKPRNAILAVLAVTVVAALFLSNRRQEPATPAAPAVTEPSAGAPAPAAPAPQPVAVEERVPVFHASAEAAKPLPKTLPASKFEIPAVARAYAIAQRIPGVLAQQPCYCWCDKFGHGSLLDCYKTDHAAG